MCPCSRAMQRYSPAIRGCWAFSAHSTCGPLVTLHILNVSSDLHPPPLSLGIISTLPVAEEGIRLRDNA